MIQQSTDYFEHDADIGVVARSKRLESVFEAAAEATFAIMADLSKIKPQQSLYAEFEEGDVEMALVTWLNLLLGEARCRGLALARFKIRRSGSCWSGEAWGEPWREDLERGVEVKGATLTMLSVTNTDGEWEARCVVDV